MTGREAAASARATSLIPSRLATGGAGMAATAGSKGGGGAGLVEVAPDGVFVIEALGKVSRTPIAAWIRRGDGRRYTALRKRDLTPEAGAAVVGAARAFLGKPYDARFEWSDDRLYCSELVAKAYQRGANLSAGRLQRIADLNIGPILAAARARYGDKLPLDRKVLTPASLAEDPGFVTVHDDFHPMN